MDIAPIATWTFTAETAIPRDIDPVLVSGETPVAAYQTFRDSAVFTNRRLVVRDTQGMTGKKVQTYSLPYGSINMWASENAGKLLDPTAELELWTRSGHIKINLGKGVDVRRLDLLLSGLVINGR